MAPEGGKTLVKPYKQIKLESGTISPKQFLLCGQRGTNATIPVPFGNDGYMI